MNEKVNNYLNAILSLTHDDNTDELAAIRQLALDISKELYRNNTCIKVKIIENGKAPAYMHPGDACADCYARVHDGGSFVIHDGQRAIIPLGFAIELPDGYEAVIRPRSGLSKNGVDIAEGTVDSNYRGEVAACLINHTGADYTVVTGDRICQIKIQQAETFEFVKAEKLSDTERGIAGFGSTGI